MKLAKRLKQILNPKPITDYVSDIDVFLAEFNKTHAESSYQRYEREKQERVAYLRDHAIKADLRSKLWEEF